MPLPRARAFKLGDQSAQAPHSCVIGRRDRPEVPELDLRSCGSDAFGERGDYVASVVADAFEKARGDRMHLVEAHEVEAREICDPTLLLGVAASIDGQPIDP